MRACAGNSQASVPLTITRSSSMYVGQRDTIQPGYQVGLAAWLWRSGLGRRSLTFWLPFHTGRVAQSGPRPDARMRRRYRWSPVQAATTGPAHL
jgi:hypothetical protein